MDQKLAATIGVVMLIATVGAYSSDATTNPSTPSNSTSSYLVAANDSTLNATTTSNATSPAATAPQHPLRPHRIVCIGDSITEGFADPNNWPYHLKTRLGGDWEVIDQGVGGAFTADLLARINATLESNPRFIIIMGGLIDLGNDVPLQTTKANIDTLCMRVDSYGAVPVLCTVTPTNDRFAHHDELNAWITEYARVHGYPLIDFYTVINNKATPGYPDPALVFDGKHPNTAGYEAMGNAVDLAIFTKDNDSPQRSVATSGNEAGSVSTNNTL